MSTADRRARRVRLRAPTSGLARRGALLLEDALRTASLGGEGGRLVLVRRMDVGRIQPRGAPASVALALEARMRQVESQAVYALDASAAHAPAVWFRDAVEAHAALAWRLAEGRGAGEWFWPLAVSRWHREMGRDEALRAVLGSAADAEPGAFASIAVLAELMERGAAGPLLDALRWQDGPALLRACGWSPPSTPVRLRRAGVFLVSGDADRSGDAGRSNDQDHWNDAARRGDADRSAALDSLGAAWIAAIAARARAWGEDDARTLWLAAAALVTAAPSRLLDSRLGDRAATLIAAVLDSAARDLSQPRSSGDDPPAAPSLPVSHAREDAEDESSSPLSLLSSNADQTPSSESLIRPAASSPESTRLPANDAVSRLINPPESPTAAVTAAEDAHTPPALISALPTSPGTGEVDALRRPERASANPATSGEIIRSVRPTDRAEDSALGSRARTASGDPAEARDSTFSADSNASVGSAASASSPGDRTSSRDPLRAIDRQRDDAIASTETRGGERDAGRVDESASPDNAVPSRPRFPDAPVATEAGGLVFLIPVLQRLGIAAMLRDHPWTADAAFPARLLRALALRAGISPRDPMLAALGADSLYPSIAGDAWCAPANWTRGLAADGPFILREVPSAALDLDARARQTAVEEARPRRAGRTGVRALFDARGRLPLAAWTGDEPPAAAAPWLAAATERSPSPAEPGEGVGGGGSPRPPKSKLPTIENHPREMFTRGHLVTSHPITPATLLLAAWTLAARRWSRRGAGLGIAALIRRPARVLYTRTHVDVVFDHRDTEVRVRRAGLDLDPGWVPWLGRVVQIHYLYGERSRAT